MTVSHICLYYKWITIRVLEESLQIKILNNTLIICPYFRQHTGEKKYECDVCSRAFITRSDLKQHVMTHRGDKPHICSICGMRLSRASNLKRHITYLHDKSKTFNCSQCPSKFMNKSELTKHEKKHQGLKVPNSN